MKVIREARIFDISAIADPLPGFEFKPASGANARRAWNSVGVNPTTAPTVLLGGSRHGMLIDVPAGLRLQVPVMRHANFNLQVNRPSEVELVFDTETYSWERVGLPLSQRPGWMQEPLSPQESVKQPLLQKRWVSRRILCTDEFLEAAKHLFAALDHVVYEHTRRFDLYRLLGSPMYAPADIYDVAAGAIRRNPYRAYELARRYPNTGLLDPHHLIVIDTALEALDELLAGGEP